MDETEFSKTGDPSPPNLPRQGVRTALSFLLFLQLFAIFVAVASNFGPVSPVRRQLREVPLVASYLKLLHMDLAYNYHLTFGPGFENSGRIEIEAVDDADVDRPTAKWIFPDPDRFFGICQQRYTNLTRNALGLAEQDDRQSILPYAIARRLLAEQSVDSGRYHLRMLRYLPVRQENINSLSPAESDPLHPNRYNAAYVADLTFYEGKLTLVTAARAGESAPVERNP